MKNFKAVNKFALLLFIFVFALCFLPLSPFVARADEASTVYTTNLETIRQSGIDPDDIFTEFFDQYTLSGKSGFVDKMNDVVTVATAWKNFENAFSASDYTVRDWDDISQIINLTKQKIIITESFEKDDLLAEINLANAKIASGYVTRAQTLSAHKALNISKLQTALNSVLQVNATAPDGSNSLNTNLFLDATAQESVNGIFNQAVEQINEVTLHTKNATEKVTAFCENAITKLYAEPKNAVERAYKLINDYTFIQNDKSSSAETIELYKRAARTACSAVLENFIPNASPSVLASLSAEIKAIKVFPTSDYVAPEYDLYKDTVTSENGVVTIRAVQLLDGVAKPANVFPKNAFATIYNSANSAGKKLASKGVTKQNKYLSVAYFMYIEVYNGSNEWKVVTSTTENDKISYQVEIDLNKYYTECVANYDQGALEKLFSGISFLQDKFGTDDKYSEIVKTNKFIKNLPSSDKSSLIYSYSRNNGQSEVTSLTYELSDGGILMFDTTNFGTVAVTTNAAQSIIASPIFWAIIGVLAVIIVLLIVVIIIKNTRYSFTFITNGGTAIKPIKAKKGDYFAMPDAPTKDGFVFAGWYQDEACNVRFIDTSVSRRKSHKIYAKWIESDIPENFVKYFTALRNEINSYSKVGLMSNTGLSEKETLAKLFADRNGVYLYVKMDANRALKDGFEVEEAVDEEFTYTPTKMTIVDKETYKEAKALIKAVMAIHGLQNVGLADEEPEPMTLEERQQGFKFMLENDRVAVTPSDYYELLRMYSTCYAIYDPNDVEDGKTILRMYYDHEEDCVNVYLALSPRGDLVSAEERFADTPALYIVKELDDLKKAYEYIDKVMIANGLERRNESSNFISKLQPPKKGCGCAYTINID